MKTIDMRFDKELIKTMVGNVFHKYRCDAFTFTNTVTATVGIFVGDEVYELGNYQQAVDYFGTTDDYAVFAIAKTVPGKIKSFFSDVEQINTPINEKIQRISLVNENQRVYQDGIQMYNVWLTRGIIFDFGERQVSFMKDIVPFSEEIEIRRGYELIDAYPSEKAFLEGWDGNDKPECQREIETIE